MSPTIESTIALIRQAHAGQTDWAGVPYAEHPIAVMRLLPDSADDTERMVALLHDVVEDTSLDLRYLAMLGYSPKVQSRVRQLTFGRDGRTYQQKIQALADTGDVRLIRVKLADVLHNSDPERLAKLEPERRDRLAKKYEGARAILSEALTKLNAEFPKSPLPSRHEGRAT